MQRMSATFNMEYRAAERGLDRDRSNLGYRIKHPNWSQSGTGNEDVNEDLSTGSWSGTQLSIALEDDLSRTVWSDGWFGLRLSEFSSNVGFHSTESSDIAVRPRLQLSLQEIRE